MRDEHAACRSFAALPLGVVVQSVHVFGGFPVHTTARPLLFHSHTSFFCLHPHLSVLQKGFAMEVTLESRLTESMPC